MIPGALVVLAAFGAMLVGLLRLRRRVVRCFADWRVSAIADDGEKTADGSALAVGSPSTEEKRQLV